ncbi:DNA translocase FtsK 4TM domain-containing protein [bacterium endosymbiont of Pedicinus badii]|uniref:DNA translocase FtsK 4TM domain-containing protein n=1 Tax=bacterium endosymbiont of Pedicinus badii TaxID=1719126 RepID=UPI0009BB0EDC|nr:DNA translocase FtsK 4TM domain-containing protein [bacterium endosymbiont of Pedicinus badii]OQM34341.1 hypothetical protein AOQ89_00380 [bacterium endosymbiont of Pedicinus badii]
MFIRILSMNLKKQVIKFFFILFFLFFLYILVSLLSFDPNDPNWSKIEIKENCIINNFGGVFGSWISDILFLLFGKAIYFILLFFYISIWRICNYLIKKKMKFKFFFYKIFKFYSFIFFVLYTILYAF